jgi:hypothetical protein
MFTEVKSVWVGLDEQRLDWYDGDGDSASRLN